MKMIIALVVILVLVCGWVYYERHDTSNTFGNGAITSRDGGPPDKSNDNPAISDTRSTSTTADNTTASTAQPASQPFNQNNGQTVATPTSTVLPADNTQAANAPDQLRFAGAGRYQWYRQGDLTWRIDTVSGAMCVAFATMPEWRNPDVISHGCGNA